jgi:hypothetical protein
MLFQYILRPVEIEAIPLGVLIQSRLLLRSRHIRPSLLTIIDPAQNKHVSRNRFSIFLGQ